jgi:hypothetical protein
MRTLFSDVSLWSLGRVRCWERSTLTCRHLVLQARMSARYQHFDTVVSSYWLPDIIVRHYDKFVVWPFPCVKPYLLCVNLWKTDNQGLSKIDSLAQALTLEDSTVVTKTRFGRAESASWPWRPSPFIKVYIVQGKVGSCTLFVSLNTSLLWSSF